MFVKFFGLTVIASSNLLLWCQLHLMYGCHGCCKIAVHACMGAGDAACCMALLVVLEIGEIAEVLWLRCSGVA